MTRKMTGLIAAGSLAIGIVLGGAGAIVARDDAAPDMASMMGAGSMGDMTSMMSMMGGDSMGDMTSMMGGDSMGDMTSMMGAVHMAEMASMMSMMGGDSPMSPNASTSPGPSLSPAEHESHHVSSSPDTKP